MNCPVGKEHPEETGRCQNAARILPYSILSTTISSSLPKPWILGKTLYSSPGMIISWLQLHRDLERKTYWLLVLFITNTWREMKHKGHGSKQGQLNQNTVCSVTWKKPSQTSASPTDNFSSSASPVEPASFRLLPVPISFIYFLGHCSGTGASSWASSVKIRWLETLNKYSISDL